MNQHLAYHLQLIKSLAEAVAASPRLNGELPVDDTDQRFLQHVQQLSGATAINESLIETGQQVLTRIVTRYPELMPAAHRDLFWFFGGDCLHYMPDGEISRYQQLDEARFAAEDNGETFDYAQARAKAFGLH